MSIAIGHSAGQSAQPANSIVINATGVILNGVTANAFYVDPIRALGSTNGVFLAYNTTSKEIQYASAAKNFIIDHPQDQSKYLIHACLEGPEAGVYYRGKAYVDHVATIELPKYAQAFDDFTVHITPINNPSRFMVSEVHDNKFTVSIEEPSYVHWMVMGSRSSIDVEVPKDSINVYGDGPYKYYSRK